MTSSRAGRPSLHVFNVAGVMLNGHNDSLEKWLRKDLAPDDLVTFAPIPKSRVLDTPAAALARTGDAIDAFLARLPPEGPDVRVLAIGRSFGGYMLLKALSEDLRRLARFSCVVAIESPLAPDVEVSIPTLLPVLLPAARHYRERPIHAAAMLASLRDEHLAKVVTIGNTIDSVITPASMRLPFAAGAGRTVHWARGLGPADALAAPRTHVVLPPFPPGFSIETALLPTSYRGHLTWGDEKHTVVSGLLAACVGAGQPS